MPKIRIIIADDHPVFLAGLKTVVDAESDIQIVGQASDGNQALQMLEELRPDMAVLDIGMPKIDGVGLLTEIRKRQMSVGVIFMTMYRERKLYDRGMELGLLGYVLKDSASSDLIEAIRTVVAGDRFVSPDLLSHFTESRSRSGEIRATQQQLSASEMRILSLIAEYKTSREIADTLYISPRTVETHRTNISTKLGLQGRHALMKYALSLFEKKSS
ncbi:MAG TPA: response regulator transcription factor [Pyrinomonadaceae bacterium]|nr:response regulator transcription factor [Pyrinomonadaceae bacterium]